MAATGESIGLFPQDTADTSFPPPDDPSQCCEVKVMGAQGPADFRQRRATSAFVRRFGEARNFFSGSHVPTEVSNNTQNVSLEHLSAQCQPALEGFLFSGEPQTVQPSRPQSALSTASVSGKHPLFSRPTSALSCTTKELNETAASVLSALSRAESAGSLLGNRRRASRGFMLTEVAEDDYDRWDADAQAAVPTTSSDDAKKKPIPFFLTKAQTWKRILTTKADKEAALMKEIETQMAQLQLTKRNNSQKDGSNSKPLENVGGYASGLDEEHRTALLQGMTMMEKLDVLRADTQKRRNFSNACDAMTEWRKRQRAAQKAMSQAGAASQVSSKLSLSNEKLQNAPPALRLIGTANDGTSAFDSGCTRHCHFVPSDSDPDSPLRGDKDDERKYFSAASKMAQEIEKKEREEVAREKRSLFVASRLLRAAEDIEKPDISKARHFTDTQTEIRRNAWTTYCLIAAHMGSWLATLATSPAFVRAQHEANNAVKKNRNQSDGTSPTNGAKAPARFDSGVAPISKKILAVVGMCGRLIELRKEAFLRASVRRIWSAWLRGRNRFRCRRRDRSVALILKFLKQRKYTMQFVMAVKRFVRTVRVLQSMWKSTLLLRGIRKDLAISQVTRALNRTIQEDTQKAKALKDSCRQQECEIANRKGIPRLVKSEMINELKRHVEAEISACQLRARKSEALRDSPAVVEQVVIASLERKHREYHQQVARFAKAVAAYDRDILQLREKGIIVVRRRKKLSQKPAHDGKRSNTSTPLTSHRDHNGSKKTTASALESSRRTAVNSQLEHYERHGKIYVEEPTTLSQMHSGITGGSGSSHRSASVAGLDGSLPSARASHRASRADLLTWNALKERGVIGHIPTRPIQPFFHSLFHPKEISQLVEAAPI